MVNKENKVKLNIPKKLTKQKRNVTNINQILTIIINNYEM